MTELYVELRGLATWDRRTPPMRVSRVYKSRIKHTPLSVETWRIPYPNADWDKLHYIDFHVHKGHRTNGLMRRYQDRMKSKLDRIRWGFRVIGQDKD